MEMFPPLWTVTKMERAGTKSICLRFKDSSVLQTVLGAQCNQSTSNVSGSRRLLSCLNRPAASIKTVISSFSFVYDEPPCRLRSLVKVPLMGDIGLMLLRLATADKLLGPSSECPWRTCLGKIYQPEQVRRGARAGLFSVSQTSLFKSLTYTCLQLIKRTARRHICPS